MSFTLPSDVDERPMAIDGAGTLGQRIAAVYAAGGSDVRIFDLSQEAREAARDYVAATVAEFARQLDVPEKLDLKRKVFGQLDAIAEPDAILASNSSSLPTSQMIDEVEHPERVLNTHYQQPPELNSVELMSCGKTDEGFNRIWASIKRDCLMVAEEGVASPGDVDRMWEIFTKPGIPPFELMDRVGLDVVLNIEERYAKVRDGIPEEPRNLLREYIDSGRLGVNSGRGFYDHQS